MKTFYCHAPRALALLALFALSSCAGRGITPAGDLAAEAEGVWHVEGDGRKFDLVIFPGGQCVGTSRQGPRRVEGLRGFWRTGAQEITVIFEEGSSLVIRRRGELWVARQPALDGRPQKWNYTLTPVTAPDADFIGVWRLNPEPDAAFLYVNLESGGVCHSSLNPTRPGRWSVVGGAARCVWPDGWIDVISRTDRGYRKESLPPGGDSQNIADTSIALHVGADAFEFLP